MGFLVFQAVQKAAMPGVMPHDIIDLDYDLMDGEVGLNEVELNEVEGVFDSVCAFCDDGGEILWYALCPWYLIFYSI